MRIFGIDYGDKKIGLAFGDSETGVALPLEVIRNDGAKTVADLAARVKSEDFEKIVVGVPLATGGHHGPEQLEKTRKFIGLLKDKVSVPIEEEDESYTSSESIRLQREEGAEAAEDALAAMLILEQYFGRA
jgi:putative Holliday junction resolvase